MIEFNVLEKKQLARNLLSRQYVFELSTNTIVRGFIGKSSLIFDTKTNIFSVGNGSAVIQIKLNIFHINNSIGRTSFVLSKTRL
jgi:hypothetical protein